MRKDKSARSLSDIVRQLQGLLQELDSGLHDAAEETPEPIENAEPPTAQGRSQSGLPLRDVLLLGLPPADVYLVHETADVGFIPASGIAELTDAGRDEFAGLLNAVVTSIRPGAYGVELVLNGVDPQDMMDFDEAQANHRNAAYTIGLFGR